MNSYRLLLPTLALACLLLVGTLSTQAQAGPNPAVIMETTMGRIILMLYPSEAPITVKNFLRYVDEGFYDGTIFHRVVKSRDFKIIQGGGYAANLNRKRTHAPIVNESSKAMINKKGTIAMARTNHPDSATAQFFINVMDNTAFDYKTDSNPGYAAFGRVIRGMDVVEKINAVSVGKRGPFVDIPNTPVIIKKMYRAK